MTNALRKQADWHIPEDAPLPWLVSLLFTRDFWNPLQLTQGRYNFFGPTESSSIPPTYKSFEDVYLAAAQFVSADEAAKAFYDAAVDAIAVGDLAYVQPETNEWGDKIGFKRDDEVDTFKFLSWAEKRGYRYDDDLLAVARYAIMRHHDHEQAAEREAYSFPIITADQFERKRQEPLWRVGTAILYLLGRRSRSDGKEHQYKGDGGLYDKLLNYVRDANTSHLLTLAAPDYVFPKVSPEKDDHAHQHTLDSKVPPEQFIAWAKTLPVSLPMLGSSPTLSESPAAPAYCTPDMALMFDAIAKFWSHYDLANPNPSIAPVKKEVVAWLVKEAAERGIAGFSESRAKVLDTIMRCPEARKGGNTL